MNISVTLRIVAGACPGCGDSSWGGILCWTCGLFRAYAVPARALCNGIHRGAWPDREAREPVSETVSVILDTKGRPVVQ